MPDMDDKDLIRNGMTNYYDKRYERCIPENTKNVTQLEAHYKVLKRRINHIIVQKKI